uniref:Apoptosis-antagonizing transcription factor C-terminal domain-containing protein n=1 Tax=Leptocylindrus danicus TaxID=163516 RepID=A0A7S2KFP0_9STRA|mmetsp:Transcript_21793/g.32592  ORF Transcript_21793/g.32592 Transcript_21793/m.32592 type:complete len:292 (+) Transcript_21793:121-996(+)|eukprot:CAMPEP_0116019594 /NCGR_PEP_ID=MMETSP0321-20121206/9324_1 /TAXON_ID=163516 /ORGANISM="Leptocylindrus danicus var. danicus, Strain B650" /LENGTH=291 /DNA_ID=CAMNT_0003490183 /DNA_START=46 /DNA_END=921 /DNA_ORIENTATION=+
MGKRSALFDKLAEIDSSDLKAAKRRRNNQDASIAQSHAAKSQLEQSNALVEARILLQRAVAAVQSIPSSSSSSSLLKIKQADDVVTKLVEARSTLMRSSADDNNDMDAKLQSQYERCRSMWKKVLDKRQEDLNLASGKTTSKKFQVIDQGIWGQVEATVAHEKLRRRVLSEEEEEEEGKNDRYNFDDSKIYQQMLKDFIANGASTTSATSKEEAEKMQSKLNGKKSKKKKVVDRRASKDRRLKYTVNEKLENFTFPIARPVPLIDEDDWFKSLFGGAWRNQQKVIKQKLRI